MGHQTKRLRQNRALQREFFNRGLDLSQVWQPKPDDPDLENRQLNHLLQWVKKFERCHSRKKMEADGFLFPPIDPDFSPDVDWDRFQRWMAKEPISARLRDLLPNHNWTQDPNDMKEEEIEAAVDTIQNTLKEYRHEILVMDGMPTRLLYRQILDEFIRADTMIPLSTAENTTWVVDFCSGYCPDCLQRPWCDHGQLTDWPEDEKAGRMVVPDAVRTYVSSVALEL